MLDYHISKWSWTQRFILISYIFTYWYWMSHPYAKIVTEMQTKYFKPVLNPLKHITMFLLFIAGLYCFGLYKIKFKRYFIGVISVCGVDLVLNVLSIMRDGRTFTKDYFIGLLLIGVTIALIYWDSTLYVYEELRGKKETHDTL